jgi:hypothetical protein
MANEATNKFRTRAFLNRLKGEMKKNSACTGTIDPLKPQAKFFQTLLDVNRTLVENAWAGALKRGFNKGTINKFAGVIGLQALDKILQPAESEIFLDALDLSYALSADAPLPTRSEYALTERDRIYIKWLPTRIELTRELSAVHDSFRREVMQLYQPSDHLRMLHYMYFLAPFIDCGCLRSFASDLAVLLAIAWGFKERDLRSNETTETFQYGYWRYREYLLGDLDLLLFRFWKGEEALCASFSGRYFALCGPNKSGSYLQMLVNNSVFLTDLLVEQRLVVGRRLLATRRAFQAQIGHFGMTNEDVGNILVSGYCSAGSREKPKLTSVPSSGQIRDIQASMS